MPEEHHHHRQHHNRHLGDRDGEGESDDERTSLNKSPSFKPQNHDREAERRISFVDAGNDEEPLQLDIPEAAPAAARPEAQVKKDENAVTWMSLPRKSQLAILFLARLSEPLVQHGLRSYIFYQLKSFDPKLPDGKIAAQAGLMQSAFAGSQLCMALVWGRLSDLRGRKGIILFGLLGAMLSCIGFAFSRTFAQALVFRCMGGALNGNVGVMRTMVSEIIREKKFQSRAFLILPMCANIGVIVGPMIGGITSDPVSTYPGLFGGIKWLEKYPYAPPQLCNAVILCSAALAVFFGLEETHETFGQKDDIGIRCSRLIARLYRKLRGRAQTSSQEYQAVPDMDPNTPIVEMTPTTTKSKKRVSPKYPNKLPFRRIFTKNVLSVLLSHGLLAASMGTFQSIFYTYLSTPVYVSSDFPDYTPHPPLTFTGGVGLHPGPIGIAMATLGTLGICLQLLLYPQINGKMGTLVSWRIFLFCFPITYTLTPFLSLIPSTTPPPSPKTGILIWIALTCIIFVFVMGRTFAAPASTILLNNCSPHPTVLGTIHGIGQSVSAGVRTIFPALGGYLFGVGLEKGVVGATFWALAVIAGVACFASNFVKDGDGHEIRLEGDDEAEEEAERANRILG